MRYKITLFLIILLAAILRLYRLSEIPAINADEAAIGYNALSLLTNGLDEHGNAWPVHFQSFNDWKPGLIFYLVIPVVKLFGLTAFAIRVIPALFGVGTVVVLYFLIVELFKDNLKKDCRKFALAASFMLAISPWHIHFSRGAWEANVATFFTTTAILCFMLGRRIKPFFIPSAILFALSLYTYHAGRVTTPLVGLFLGVFYFKDLWKNKVSISASAILFGILLVPLAIDFFGPAGLSRASGVGLFADSGPIHKINEQRGHHAGDNPGVTRALHNKVTTFTFAFLQNWTKHFDGSFLFIKGDEIERNKVPEMGQLHLFEIITIGVAVATIAKRPHRSWLLILVWLLITPVAASLTFQSPHALRAQSMSAPLAIISGYGLFITLNRITRAPRVAAVFFTGATLIIIIWSISFYLQMYYVHMPKQFPFSSQYGVEELFNYIAETGDNYEKIIITDRYDQPYILALYYLGYPPEEFQDNHALTSRDEFGFSTVRSFDKYNFRSINFQEDKENHKNALIVGTDEEIPDEANIIHEIYGSNGYKYFQIIAN